jgi:hypothetical protein
MRIDIWGLFRPVLIAAAVVVGSIFFEGCADSAPRASAPGVARLTEPPALQKKVPAVQVSAAEFHARNKMDWVGVMHNKAMDRLRREIHDTKPKNLCKTIERIGVEVAAAAERDRLAADVFDRIGCKGPNGPARFAAFDPGISEAGWTLVSARQAEDFALSPEAWSLVNEVMAIEGETPGEVASQLAGVSAAAQSLPADQATVVDALASVSLSSFEYWSANANSMAQEFSSSYGGCVGAGGGDGCYYAIAGAPGTRKIPIVRLAANRSVPRMCSIGGSSIWPGDKWGAITGLTIGALTRTVQGAVIGLVGGAAIGSGGAVVYEFGKFLACAFK